jgi:hypothetical protein
LDAFHYLSSKKAVISELKRISTAEALWLFPHLHNRLQQNLVAGTPLSPEGYLDCFGFPEARIFDETEMLRGLTKERVLDLGQKPSASNLNASQTLTFVRGGDEIWRKHNGFPSALCASRSNLVINPIYRQRIWSEGVELELAWPNNTMRNECRGAEAVLPTARRLSRADLGLLNDKSSSPDRDRLSDLVAEFVLVPLPPDYVGYKGERP